MTKEFHPLVEKARQKNWGVGGFVKDQDIPEFFSLTPQQQAQYLGALVECPVVISLGEDPKYGPDYQVVRYASVGFWYSQLKDELRGTPLASRFGVLVDLSQFGGRGKYDSEWITEENRNTIKGPETYFGYILPRQLIDIMKVTYKRYEKSKNVQDLVSRRLFLALEIIKQAPSLEDAVVQMAVLCKSYGCITDQIIDRVFDVGYQEEMPREYWEPILVKVENGLRINGIKIPKTKVELVGDALILRKKTFHEVHTIRKREILRGAGYRIETFIFLGEKGENADGSLFVIDPHKTTRVVRIVKDGVLFQDAPIEGNGWFLGISHDGEIVCYQFKNADKTGFMIEYKKGWVMVWVAGDKGLKVAEINEPKYSSDSEEEVSPEDQSIPPNFWEILRSLKQGNYIEI